MATPLFPTTLYKHRGKAADHHLSLDEWNQVGVEVQALEKTLNEALGNPANEPGDNVVSPPWSLTVSALTWGKQTIKGRLVDADDASDIQIRSNWKNISPIAKDDIAYAGWMIRLGGVTDEFSIWRADTGTPPVATTLVKVNTTGKLTAKSSVQAGGSVTPAAEGWVLLNPGNATTNPGYVAFHIQDGTRRGYVGWKHATTTHLQLGTDAGCAGWEVVVPASDDGFKITNATQPSLFFDTPARAGIWFGNTANTGRWYYGHEGSGGAGMGLRMYNGSAGGDMFKFLFSGDLYAGRFWQGLGQFTWSGWAGGSNQVLPASGDTILLFNNVYANPGGMYNTWRMDCPADSIVLLGCSVIIGAAGHVVSIAQSTDGSTWKKRSSVSYPVGAIASAYSTFAICDTRAAYGRYFCVLVTPGSSQAIVYNDTGPWFWAIVLGRAG